MTNFKGRRPRLGVLLVAALGALSIFVLPGLAGARGGSGDSGATIKSFDQTTRTLVVALPDGQTVSGTVTRRTKIRCEDESGHRGGGDRVRGREDEPGGGRGDEPGDDNGSGANCTAADLVAGAAVEEIELKFRGDSVVFDEVELDG
jgi:hypothetical protein